MIIYSILSAKRNSSELDTLLGSMKGISGTDLFAVSFDKITAVISDIKKNNIIPDKSKALEYAGVIETLAQQNTLLPMRFGSSMESTDAIIKMLERNYQDIQHNLEQVENKTEFGLKIFCDSQKLKIELVGESETKTTSKPDKETNSSVFREYVNKKLVEHRYEELLLAYIDSVIAEITVCLTCFGAVSKFKKITAATPITDVVFLLDKFKEYELVQSVENIQNQYPNLNFILTGPWPPYNFVDITIK